MNSESLNTIGYCSFGGAVGDGVADDFEAIKRTHERANITGQTVVAEAGHSFNLGRHSETIAVKTDCEWTGARFIIDDSAIEPSDPERKVNVFEIVSDCAPCAVSGITALKAGEANVGVTFDHKVLLLIVNSNEKQYIRYGLNGDGGADQQEIILVDEGGNVDPSTPIMWDYDTVTSATAFSAGDRAITIRGGEFVTVANRAPRRYTYYSRGILVTRSNTTFEGITHLIEGEGESGAPYAGFIYILKCNNVLFENCVFTAHKTYKLETDVRNSMGTYDFGVQNSNSVVWRGCSQTNDIHDRAYWGIMGTNYCKNLKYESCSFSRFDAHKGTYNTSIIDSEIGHQNISVVGCGTIYMENTSVTGENIIGLRGDYGSTWQGDVVLRNVVFNNTSQSPVLIGGDWCEHYFGYTCYMPENVTIEGLKVTNGDEFFVFRELDASVTENATNPYIPPKVVRICGCKGDYKYGLCSSNDIGTTAFRDTELVK